jgi:hypothetical protein
VSRVTSACGALEGGDPSAPSLFGRRPRELRRRYVESFFRGAEREHEVVLFALVEREEERELLASGSVRAWNRIRPSEPAEADWTETTAPAPVVTPPQISGLGRAEGAAWAEGYVDARASSKGDDPA